MKVWRIHLKNDIDHQKGYEMDDLYDFCFKEKLIGVGWGKIDTRINDEAIIRQQAAVYAPNETAGIKALNAMRKMCIDDLIWTMIKGVYYLCRVTKIWENSKPTQKHLDLDIANYVNVEWLEIGKEQHIPGKVISNFRPSASAQTIWGMNEISMYMWNLYSKTEHYSLAKTTLDIWSVLSDKDVEELVLLYLQIEKGYYIYSSTVKTSFPQYECQMVNAQGKHAYPQVKTGNVALDANNYIDIFKYDSEADVYLFATSENYTSNDAKNVHFLYRNELEKFIKENKKLLPTVTQYWLDLCGKFSDEKVGKIQ